MPQTRTYRPTQRNLALLANVLARGGLVAVPSETVYGLAADALNPDACRRIFEAKGRPSTDPLIVHIDRVEQLDQLARPPREALILAKAFWPGPLTLVLPKRPCVPDLVTAGLDSVAVRMPDHPLFRDLIRRSGRPLAAPSANPFGYISPTTAAHVELGLHGRIEHILDGGPCTVGVESTIIDLRTPQRPRLLRPGAVSAEQIAAALGTEVESPTGAIVPAHQAAAAPGMLLRHYSPHLPMRLHARIPWKLISESPADEAFLLLKKPTRRPLRENIFWLTTDGALPTAARRLFHMLRQLDSQGGWRCIHAELAGTKKGLAPAINDRLTRAAAKG